jgi:hypothetical protein
MGTELSMVALRNQVRRTVWYGEEAFPVQDARWIAKQYYHDLLDYAQLPTNQETFDKSFQTSFNMCDERVSDFSFITVEDDRNNLFEMRRNFATIAQQQGFVNVISSEYMLREYMAANPELFTADAKAIPYITADYARTKRNENYAVLARALGEANKLQLITPDGPFCYPFYCKDGMRIKKELAAKKIYVPTLWPNVLDLEGSLEKDFAENILPLPCDQRYDEGDMRRILEVLDVCISSEK